MSSFSLQPHEGPSETISEMVATGIPGPKDSGVELKVSHPDLSADFWGWLFPRFSSGAVNISAGTTIASADYDRAYFGYYDDSGSWTETVLSGDSDLKILDTAGLDGTETVDDENVLGAEATTNGEIVVGIGPETPDAIKFPGDFSGWKIQVVGDVNEDIQPISNVSERENDAGNTEYYLPSSGLSDGETLEEVVVQPEAEYTQAFEAESNPGNIDQQKLADAVETQQDILDSLENMDSGGAAAGGLFGGAFPDPVAWLDNNFPGGTQGAAAAGGGLGILWLLN